MEITSNIKTSYDQVFSQIQSETNKNQINSLINTINKEKIEPLKEYAINLKSADFSYNKDIGEFVVKVKEGRSSFQIPTEEIVKLKVYLKETA